MASYLETQLRKQRHSKSIVARNNARRQLLLKQQPDVGDVTEDTSGEEVPVEHRSYWEDDEADGYDERIRWIRGPEGAFYYDGRAGVRTFGDSIPEGFISEREFGIVADHVATLTGLNGAEVRRDLQTSESSLSLTWRAAVDGTYTDNHPSSVEGTSMELMNGVIDRYGMGTGSAAVERAGSHLVSDAQSVRRQQVAALAEDGAFTTEYVENVIRQREDEEAEQGYEIINGNVVHLDTEEEEVQPIEAEGVQPTPRRRTMPYEKVGVSETVFESLSPWGQASLVSSKVADGNLSLFRTFPDVWLSDAGDAEIPSSYKEAGQTLEPKSRGTVLKKNTKYVADLVRRANAAIDNDNRKTINEYLRKLVAEEGGTHQSHAPTVNTVLYGDDITLLKEAAIADGVPEEIVSQLKERATTFTFEEWMKQRDTLYKRYLSKARNQQESNKEQYGSYLPQKVELFDEEGTGVVGTATPDWIKEHGSFVKDAFNSFKELQSLDIPSSARVWPPEEEGLSSKDGSRFTDKLQVGEGPAQRNVRELIIAWFRYNVDTLRLTNPVKASNEDNWGFGAGEVEQAARSIVDNNASTRQIISIDNKGAIGAALTYYGGGPNWTVGTAGTSPKGFSSWPVNEIRVAIETAINERVSELVRQGKVRSRRDLRELKDPDHENLREVMKGWKDHGGALQSASKRNTVDRSHAAHVFFEFGARFLRKGGESVHTSGISPYVRDHYKRFGFVDAYEADRLNILWTVTTQGGSYLPRQKNPEGEDDVILKSFGTGLNKVAYTEKHDTIKTDNPLDSLQEMLDTLMNKADERYGFTDKKLAQANEQELEDLQDNLEMDDEEFKEYLEGFMYMFAGTGHTESSE